MRNFAAMEMIDLANNDANTVLNALEAGLRKAGSDSERGQKFSLGTIPIRRSHDFLI